MMGCSSTRPLQTGRIWNLQDAKNHFSEVFELALTRGPQVVTRRGTSRVVILSYEEYRCLTQPQGDLVEFFQNSPLAGVELDLARIQDYPRDIDIGE
jgi:prevent-host-death family protein